MSGSRWCRFITLSAAGGSNSSELKASEFTGTKKPRILLCLPIGVSGLRIGWSCSCVLLSVFLVADARGSTLYTLSNIGPASLVTQVNEKGEVIGALGESSFLYNGTQHIIPNPPGATFSAGGINNAGQVVGTIRLSNTFSYSTGVFSNGILQVITGSQGAAGSHINDSGQIAGDLVGQYTGFYYSGGNLERIGPLPGDFESTPRSMNAAGDVLLYSAGRTGHAAIYSHGVLTAVPGAAGYDLQPEGLNNKGQIVGSVTTGNSSFPSEAALISNGQLTLLGALPGSGASESFANGINDAGIVVGGTLTGPSLRAMAYYDGIGLVDLNSVVIGASGWTLQIANSVNSSGQIAGFGLLNGVQSGFLLTPVPEPQSAGITIAGMLLVGAAIMLGRRG
jgi:uncharacterized membrane protein